VDKKSIKGGNNGRKLALKVGYKFENLRPLLKPNLQLK
jgi:hypothetical protein